MTVTVDANENVVYEGRVPELMRSQLLQTSSFEEKEEFRLLRRLLRLVAPLNLHDPSGPEFSADNCRTVHDVIRYVHEMTVREMVSGPQWRRHKGLTPRELEFGVPLDLVVIDIGGGVREGAGKKIRHEELRCGPLLSLLESLARPGVWVTGPALLDLRGLMASSTRTPALTSPVAVMPERNVALVTSDSLCLNLKLGYHYNLVDCRASENPVENYVYFRFAGGVTELERRCRRARLLAMILEHYDFVVETSSDLVIGRLRNAGRERVNKIMYMLGRLIGYTRQLDIYLQNDRRVEECYRSFLDGRTAADLTANGGNDGKG
ncbi:MAG: hypothetical protein D6806_10320 [Deltaproteobacteria bacterium]|nr:MAG: hypothetical protein D6806_10320 [Deltaproteobacteria bacterium]